MHVHVHTHIVHTLCSHVQWSCWRHSIHMKYSKMHVHVHTHMMYNSTYHKNAHTHTHTHTSKHATSMISLFEVDNLALVIDHLHWWCGKCSTHHSSFHTAHITLPHFCPKTHMCKHTQTHTHTCTHYAHITHTHHKLCTHHTHYAHITHIMPCKKAFKKPYPSKHTNCT